MTNTIRRLENLALELSAKSITADDMVEYLIIFSEFCRQRNWDISGLYISVAVDELEKMISREENIQTLDLIKKRLGM